MKSAAVSCRSSGDAPSTGRAVAARKNGVKRNEHDRERNESMVKVSQVTATAKVQTPPVFGTEGHAVMETYTYSHFPSEVSTVHLALYSNVSNAADLRKRLVSAATLPGEGGEREREAVNYAFVDAKLVSIHLAASSFF